ncbi:hypothetical protein CFK41_14300 [Brachybacterium ginsengisoli]|uniref:Uncharacterized protein n=1 Tax=Brachybacterium ginsengisoli TaxID=1331682 RepID=A0A291H036_9MICO|nr:hypothetical protein [Brachybacterium ginsengisoli]ATG55815.1 hypothetical protein CFK41_14300 [Brachybacterium ginsengisoli]
MWLLPALLAVGVVLGFLVRLATRPIRTLVNTVRVLLFLLGVLLVATYFLVGSEVPAESRQELLPYIVAVFGAWALTFLIPGVIGLLLRSRDRE